MDSLLASIASLGALGFAALFAGSALFNSLSLWLVMNKLMPKELAGASFVRCLACSALLAVVFIISTFILLLPVPFFTLVFVASVAFWYKGSMAVLEGVFELPGGNFSALFLYTASSIGLWFLLANGLPGGAKRTVAALKNSNPVNAAMSRATGGEIEKAEKDATAVKNFMNTGTTAGAATPWPSPVPNAPVEIEPRRYWARPRHGEPTKVKELKDADLEIRQVFRSSKLEAEDLPKLVEYPEGHMVIGILVAREQDLSIEWRDPVLIHREPTLPGPATAPGQAKSEEQLEEEWETQRTDGYYPYLSDWPRQGDRYRAFHAFRLVPAVSDGAPYNDGVFRYREGGKDWMIVDPRYEGHPDVYAEAGWKVNNYLFFALPNDIGLDGWLFSPGPPYEASDVRIIGSIEKAVKRQMN